MKMHPVFQNRTLSSLAVEGSAMQRKIIFWQLGAALYCQCCHNQLSSLPPFWSTPPTPHGGIDKIDSDGGEFVEYVNLASMMNNISFFGNYMDPKKTLLVGSIYRYSA